MISRSFVFAAVLFAGACSKSDPGTSTTTAAPAAASASITTGPAAPTTPAAPAAPADDHAANMMNGMSPGMHMSDGGMGRPMGPMPGMAGHK